MRFTEGLTLKHGNVGKSYTDICMILREQITVTRYVIDLSLRKMHEYLSMK